jgi:preprotein translocase subunit SecA
MNKQREVIYSLRNEILKGNGISEIVENMIDEMSENLVARTIDPKDHPEDWDIQDLAGHVSRIFGFMAKIAPEDIGEDDFASLGPEDLTDMIKQQSIAAYRERENLFGKEDMKKLGQLVMLQIIDNQWVTHLQDMENMKEGIGLRGYGQLDPLREYKKEGFALFEELMDRISEESLSMLFRFQLIQEREEDISKRKKRDLQLSHGDGGGKAATVKRKGKKVGRNAPCPCGSGKKYKKCCGAN